jgi:hypothetical protein
MELEASLERELPAPSLLEHDCSCLKLPWSYIFLLLYRSTWCSWSLVVDQEQKPEQEAPLDLEREEELDHKQELELKGVALLELESVAPLEAPWEGGIQPIWSFHV